MTSGTAEPSKPVKHTVHWFRKGLRLHDNPSLRDGLKNSTTFRCVFIIDPWFAGSSNVGINKWRFLLQCLEDLDRSLRKLNSRLFVIRGQPADALPKLFKEWGTTNLTFEEDPEPFGRVRDLNIMAMCKELGISVVSKASHTLYKLDHIIEKNGGKPPLTYHQFQTVVSNMDSPPQPEETVIARFLGASHTPVSDDHDAKYGVPTLEELGFETDRLKPPVWCGGESEALARLERHLERKAWVASFGHPKMTPQSLLASQTGLSPYLRFGCLSTRLFYYQLTELYKKIKKAVPPLSLHGQLLWREFFYCAATKNPNFDKMNGNPICVQIPWDDNAQALAKWANGQTGFPWIDAIMTQLREEGWIHHLARHAVACFLTRGDLWISWEEGMKVFDELLLDADWSVNAGMWMWLSCSSFFQQFFHCYCPVRFGRKADPNGDYIRKYLPVLKNFPTKYIHEPWLAPEVEQRAAKCIIGKDFPLPMVNHSVVSRMNIERMKQVYRQLSKYRGQGVLATVPKSTPSGMFLAPVNKETASNNQYSNQRKNYENSQQQTKNREKETELIINRTPVTEYYNCSGNVGLIQRNINMDAGYNEDLLSPNQYSHYTIDKNSHSFQTYRPNIDSVTLSPYRNLSKVETEYRSSGLENSPENYTQNTEIRNMENHSNSMNTPFENMDIRSKNMDSPVLNSLESQQRTMNSPNPSFIVMESVEQTSNNYHFQNERDITNTGGKSNEYNNSYNKKANFSNSAMFDDSRNSFDDQTGNNNFTVQNYNNQFSSHDEKSKN